MSLQALAQLMQADCGGRRSITPTPDSILFGGMAGCKTFRRDIEAVRIEGEPAVGGSALQAMEAACTERKEVRLGLKDGGTLAVPCPAPYRPRERFYGADLARILDALMRD